VGVVWVKTLIQFSPLGLELQDSCLVHWLHSRCRSGEDTLQSAINKRAHLAFQRGSAACGYRGIPAEWNIMHKNCSKRVRRARK
jgi:hypothetical protein